MKRTLISVGMWLVALALQAQKTETPYKRRKIRLTEVQILYANYLQNGIHSAVTGGKGTENLQVYAPDVRMSALRDSTAQFSFDLGTDIITSASTDKIDYVVSSASRVDFRTHSRLSVNRLWAKRGISAGGSAGVSVESDYFSRQFGLNFSRSDENQNRTFSIDIQAYFDDLRWGRINPGYFRPVKLIYPSELRDRQWFNATKRNSFNLNLAMSQVISRKARVQFHAGVSLQKGLLSTPFHRVYFSDTANLRVEKLPESRIKLPFGLDFKCFIGHRFILKLEPFGYWDSFGIRAFGLQAEGVAKVTPMWAISIFGRGYSQSASRYFKPYGSHTGSEPYYTSDYDQAQIQSLKAGVGLRYAPFKSINQRINWKEMDLRFSYYRRSDTLRAFTLSLLISFGVEKNK